MQIIETIELLSERIRHPKTELKPSDFHVCQRNMWFNLRNVKQITYDVRRNLFNDSLKSTVKNWIEAATSSKIFYVDRVLSNGETIDGIIKIDDEFKLLSIIILSSKQYKQTAKHGLNHTTETTIRWNLSLSSELSKAGNTLSEALVIVLCRDSFDMFQMIIENTGIDDIKSYINDVKDDESVPPAIEGHHCNWCHYKEFCNNNEIADVNCGTCANYSKDGCAFGNSTCGKHLYHPQLLEFAGHQFTAADQTRMRIDYGAFVNVTEGDHVEGRACYTSKELFAAASKKLELDPMLIHLMEVFDGRFVE